MDLRIDEKRIMWLQATEESSKKPLAKVERLSVHFYEEGIKDFETSLRMREMIAIQYWLGNKDYSFYKLMQERIPQNLKQESQTLKGLKTEVLERSPSDLRKREI